MEPKWLSRQMVLAIHDEAVAEFGGLAGVRDDGLLDSAIDRPRNLFADSDSPSRYTLAACLCHDIVENHPFLDGNKRTGLLAARAFLFLNGLAFEPTESDEVNIMVGVADGHLDKTFLEQWFDEFSVQIPKILTPSEAT